MTPDSTLHPSDTTKESAKTTADFKARFEAFQTRAKAEWSVAESRARAELGALPGKLKTGAEHALARLRGGLDLPRRTEIQALATRIDELASKLAEYESQASSAGKKA